ncbi:NAD(P)-dependent oxidoreductase [Geobacter sp. AOG2]|uniref:NAD-dependent epimerase/dehydratase family protein n=1 Tax=Geobacter sp. AOG2 TaxID=1566347 RepID=UPI001CC411F3|nr:NAD-dependent epimerase/dehydratase family protein [Geobacter sp. AOG2]GFE62139.1 UDP-glucose 4-epimerase [Geobacter sp. AOG2]
MNLEAFQNKSILITGGCGYVASAIIRLLRGIDCRIVRLDRPESAWEQPEGCCRLENLPADVRDPQVWEQAIDGIDVVFHLAAQTSTYRANSNPLSDHAINVMPMLHLLEGCRLRKCCPIICFSSTVTVAGIPRRLPVDESHPDTPLTVYDLHKLMAEQYLRWYSEQGFVRGAALRLSNVYGPGPASSQSDRGVLNRMIRSALQGETLTVYGAGDYIRDYIYVEDAARAFLAAALNGEELSGSHYIIGSGVGYSIAEAMNLVAERAMHRTGGKVTVEHVAPPAGLSPIEERHFVADTRRFVQATGWRPEVTFDQGIDLTLEAYS